MIPNPAVTYTSPNTTGTLTYTPVPGNTGTATITVTVMDNGGTANGGVNTFTRNLHGDGHPGQPGAHARPDQQPGHDPRERRGADVSLTGISDGAATSEQILTVTAASSNPALIPNPTVNYTSPNTTGIAHLHAGAQRQRHGVITVTVMDNGGTANGGINTFSQTFTVTVTPVNQPPTLNAIANPSRSSRTRRARRPSTWRASASAPATRGRP